MLKQAAHALGITAISQKSTNIVVTLTPHHDITKERLQMAMAEGKGRYLFAPGATPTITIRVAQTELAKSMTYITSLLHALKA